MKQIFISDLLEVQETGQDYDFIAVLTNRTPESVTVRMTASRKATVRVRLDTYDGKEIACFTAEPGTQEFTAPVKDAGIGRHAVYFAFSMEGEEPAAEMDFFTFD